jgi:tRNA dimethylallyltransferase
MDSQPSSSDLTAQLPPLVVVVGPTAVGKTELSLQLAEHLGGEIVSADSRLFYRGMDIGTAKPTLAERQRVPHHLIDVADPDQTWSLAMFQAAARQAIAQIHARGRLPFLVGGTGQYVRAVIEGWQAPPVQPDTRLRLALERWAAVVTPLGLHDRLRVLDPFAAAAIDPRNLRRTVRALEVILSTGRRFSAQQQASRPPYRLLVLGLTRPRPELYARIDARIDAMLAGGLVAETQALLQRGYTADLPALSAIGYREVCAHLAGRLTLEQAAVQMKRATRVFVRRQANWFKLEDPQIHWFTPAAAALPAILAWLNKGV